MTMTSNSAPARRLRSVRHTAEALDCSNATVWRRIKSGELEAVHLSARCTRVIDASIDGFIARKRAAASNGHE